MLTYVHIYVYTYMIKKQGHNHFTSWCHRSWILCLTTSHFSIIQRLQCWAAETNLATLADYIPVIIDNELYGPYFCICSSSPG